MTFPEVKENFPVLHMCRKAPWGLKKEGSPPIISVDILQQASAWGPVLAKGCTRVLSRVYESVKCKEKIKLAKSKQRPRSTILYK